MISKKKCENCRSCDQWECTAKKAYEDSNIGTPCLYWRGVKYDRADQKKKDRFEMKLADAEPTGDEEEFCYDYEPVWDDECWFDIEQFIREELWDGPE